MTLTADGRLLIGQAQATGPTNVRSNTASVVVETSLFSEDAISLTGISAEVTAGATLASATDLTITADTVTLGADALAAAGMDADGNLRTTGDLSVTTGILAATDASLAAAGDASLTIDEILNMPRTHQVLQVTGVGTWICPKVRQNEIAPTCFMLGENHVEGGRLEPDPKVTLPTGLEDIQ
ncbi:hypothetical protein AKJ29_12555 [Aliiroseovarius crassostreae]|uniref:Hedgehog/Intein (Hint) domain-containing protein n=1 Tax=Aliiroseovarius crassostreae TaxID=154981 RepID=A0A0P7JQ51_9RHOB|nr:hypothetical protein [Aliiroseovarius crassostreae]KPN63474.1 hypothetical protein AKJ29_12555 [Aliiroseovarius crassostreae]